MITQEAKLVLDIVNSAEIQRLNDAIRKEADEIRNLDAALKAGSITQQQFEQRSMQAATAITGFQTQIGGLRQGMGVTQTEIMGLSYALNDFFAVSGNLDQRLNAIANNLPMLAGRFGNVGLALSAIVPIVAAVIRNWSELEKVFGQGGTKTEADRMKELADNTARTARETLELNRLKTEQAAREAGLNVRPEGEKDLTQSVLETIGIHGGSAAVADAIGRVVTKQDVMARLSEEEKRKIAAMETGIKVAGSLEDTKALVPTLKKQLDDYIESLRPEVATRMLSDAAVNRPARDQLAAFAKRAEAAPGVPAIIKGFANDLMENDPEVVRKFDEENEAFQAEAKEMAEGVHKQHAEQQEADKRAAEDAADLKRKRESDFDRQARESGAEWGRLAGLDREDEARDRAAAQLAENQRLLDQARQDAIDFADGLSWGLLQQAAQAEQMMGMFGEASRRVRDVMRRQAQMQQMMNGRQFSFAPQN